MDMKKNVKIKHKKYGNEGIEIRHYRVEADLTM